MRKNMMLGLLTAIILSACNSSTVSISEVKGAPKSIEKEAKAAYDLQLIQDGDNQTYLVYQTSKRVSADLKQKDDVITIELDESESESKTKKPFIYKLSLDSPNHTLKVFINGKKTPFDRIKG